jgi:hypothetical protein
MAEQPDVFLVYKRFMREYIELELDEAIARVRETGADPRTIKTLMAKYFLYNEGKYPDAKTRLAGYNAAVGRLVNIRLRG